MYERRFGRVINVASVAGKIGLKYGAAYSAAKHGLIGLTRSLALEGARKGVTANAICPSWTETRMMEDAAQDLAAKNMNRAATKFAALARVELERGRKTAAIAAVDTALANSQVVEVRFLAARILIEADQISRAKDLIAGLSGEIQLEPRTYAKILQGEVALKSGDRAGAIDSLNASIGILDTWIAHFDLGRVYLSAKAWSEADSEFDRCVRRRGEAMSLFLDEEPTYAFFAPVYYYVGKARQEMGTAQFADSYRQWLEIRGGSKEDPLVPQVRKITGQ